MAVHVEQLPGSASGLPAWTSALAVVAHPDDEPFALGAVLSALVQSGCRVSVLCLTRGEASTVHGISGDLRALRAMELRDAASALGLSAAELSDHPDGGLGRVSRSALGREVRETALRAEAQGLVVFDDSGVTGHSDHIAASEAALDVATELSLPVLGWTLPISVAEQLNAEFGSTFTGHRPIDVDLTVPVERDKQRTASLAHASQAVPTSVLWRRLELLGDVEHLRWLKPPVESSQPVPAAARGLPAAPTPTELFVAGLASCVAFYARRYLRRHQLNASGLRVETSYTMASKPARVALVDLQIHVPLELPPERREGLLAAAGHCTVHSSITTAPEIAISA